MATVPRTLTRQQLQKFLPDHESVRFFENLFNQALEASPDEITALQNISIANTIEATSARAKVDLLLAELERLRALLEFIHFDRLADPYIEPTVSQLTWNVRTLTADADAYDGDWCDVDATGGDVNITLPDVLTSTGRMIAVSKSDVSANLVTVIGTVNGAVDPSITVQYTTLLMVSNGTEWRLL